MVAPGFPPEQPGTGGFRPAKLATYLPDFGWTAYVVSSTDASPRCGTEYAGAPRTVVERVKTIDSPATRLRRLRSRGPEGQPELGAGLAQEPEQRATNGSSRGPSEAPRNAGGLGDWARGVLAWGDFPDHMSGWIPGAVRATVRAVRETDASAILATGPPFAAFAVGALAARRTGRPLVLDYQDMWTLDPTDPHGGIGGRFARDPSRLRRSAMERLEGWCLDRATHVVFCAERGRDLYLEGFPEIADRMSLIEMGADPATLDGLTGLPIETGVIRHVGLVHLFQLRQVSALLRGLASLDGDVAGAARLEFVGNASISSTARIRAEAAELGLEDRVGFVERVPHAEATRRIVTAQANLVFDGGNAHLRPSKLSELWASNRPVLAFAVDGGSTANEVLREAGHLITAPYSTAEVAAALEAVRTAPSEPSTPQVPERHSRIANAHDFARVLDQISGG